AAPTREANRTVGTAPALPVRSVRRRFLDLLGGAVQLANDAPQVLALRLLGDRARNGHLDHGEVGVRIVRVEYHDEADVVSLRSTSPLVVAAGRVVVSSLGSARRRRGAKQGSSGKVD